MPQTYVALACAALIALGSTACASAGSGTGDREIAARQASVHYALQKALVAEDEWERELWRAEYERRASELEHVMDDRSAERQSRAELWRQLAATVQEVGAQWLTRHYWR